MLNAHEIDYAIQGDDLQCVEILLDPGESVNAEAGSLMMMDDGIKMETLLGDGSGETESFVGKLFSAGKRVLTGESLFMTAYTNTTGVQKNVFFAGPFPGKIICLDLQAFGGKIIAQKQAFLCAAKGVSVGIAFQKKMGAGFFGGEGFVMQKLEGDGLAFVHAGGTVVKKKLIPGEVIKIDTGCLVAMTSDIDYDIEFVGGLRNTIFGGEGVFFVRLSGPGTVWVQSLPFSRLAGRIVASAPNLGGSRKGEGSLLGGLGDLMDGDKV